MKRTPAMPQVIKPALVAGYGEFRLLGRAPTTAAMRPAAPSIHVKIGRVEVRGTPSEAPSRPVAPVAPAQQGFTGYSKLRCYRNWPA
ncbi:MAG TPA: hypothetical protein VJA21_16780 [Verrucomicrobiae bacterium]